MNLGRLAGVFGAVFLIVAAEAEAECAWVLWGRAYGLTAPPHEGC